MSQTQAQTKRQEEVKKLLIEKRKQLRCERCLILLRDKEIKYCSECLPKIGINDKDLI